MVPRDLEALSRRRAERARFLAGVHPASGEVLAFYAEIATLQSRIDPQSPARSFPALAALVREKGPKTLAEAAALDEASLADALAMYLDERDTTSPRSFFARVLLVRPPERTPSSPGRCPHCGHPPQVGAARRQELGTVLSLVCSLCLTEWPFSRGRCPACGESDESKIAYYSAPELPHLECRVCESCSLYFHTVSLAADPQAIPDVDELLGLPLDVWAREKGFEKIRPNLVGI